MTVLVPFGSLTEKQLAQAVAIYEEALASPSEWPSERLRELARAPGGPMWATAALDDDAVAGFAIDRYLPDASAWYLRYFAVRQDLRSKGWGGRILQARLALVEEEARRLERGMCTGIVIEVEAIDSPPPDADREQRARRQAFYRRHGAIPTGAQCPRPPWAPPHMPDWDLFFIPMSGWDGRMDNALRYRLVRSVGAAGYEVPPDEPWLVASLARYEAPDLP